MRFCNRIVFNKQGLQEIRNPSKNPVILVSKNSSAPRLRDRWPFLDNPKTPVELKALVTQRITRWHEYDSLYKQLRDYTDIDELSMKAGRLLDAYLDAQAIAHELDYYKKYGRVLGKHPMFRHYQQLARLRSSSIKELLREQEKTRNNIWRVNSEMKKGDKPHLDAKRLQKLQEYQMKLQEINRLLDE